MAQFSPLPHALQGFHIALGGENFLISEKKVKDQLPQFGDVGRQLLDGVSRKPIMPVMFISRNSDGTLVSKYALTPDQTSLSEMGLMEFKFDRDQYAEDNAAWKTNSERLMQMLINILSDTSKSILEARQGPDGYDALRANNDCLGLWNLIVETHAGTGLRTKILPLIRSVRWKYDRKRTAQENFADFSYLHRLVILSFQVPGTDGLMKIEDLMRMAFVLGLDTSLFPREVENIYDQWKQKTVAQLIECCLAAHMERGGDSSAENYQPAGLAAPSDDVGMVTQTASGAGWPRKRPTPPPFPEGGDPKTTTCPHCHKNGYMTTAHGQFHPDPTKRSCSWLEAKQARDKARQKKDQSTGGTSKKFSGGSGGGGKGKSSTALVTATPSMSPEDAKTYIQLYAEDGFATYVQACKIAGVDIPAKLFDDQSLVTDVTDDDMARLEAMTTRLMAAPAANIFLTAPDPEQVASVLRGTAIEQAADRLVLRRLGHRDATRVQHLSIIHRLAFANGASYVLNQHDVILDVDVEEEHARILRANIAGQSIYSHLLRAITHHHPALLVCDPRRLSPYIHELHLHEQNQEMAAQEVATFQARYEAAVRILDLEQERVNQAHTAHEADVIASFDDIRARIIADLDARRDAMIRRIAENNANRGYSLVADMDPFRTPDVDEDEFAVDLSFTSQIAQGSDDGSVDSQVTDVMAFIDHVHEVNSAVAAPPQVFTQAAHDKALARILEVAEKLEKRPHVQQQTEVATNLAFDMDTSLSSIEDSMLSMSIQSTTTVQSEVVGYYAEEMVGEHSQTENDIGLDTRSFLEQLAFYRGGAVARDVAGTIIEVDVVPLLSLIKTATQEEDPIHFTLLQDIKEKFPELLTMPAYQLNPILHPLQSVGSSVLMCSTSTAPSVQPRLKQLTLAEAFAKTTEQSYPPITAAELPELIDIPLEYPENNFQAFVTNMATALVLSVLNIFFWDTCASWNITNSLSELSPDTIRQLVDPHPLGGIGSGILVTHVGQLKSLERYPKVSRCYYSANAKHNLLSVGQFTRNNFGYWQRGDKVTVYAPDKTIFDDTTLQPNNLPPAQFLQNRAMPVVEEEVLEELQRPISPVEPDEVEFTPAKPLTRHISKEQRLRCERFRDWHKNIGIHASYAVQKEALRLGLHRYLNLTPGDVTKTEELFGPCIDCTLAKMKSKSKHESTRPPPQKVAELIHMDIRDRSCKSAAGKQVTIRMTDDFSGDVLIGGALSKQPLHLFRGIMSLVHNRYTKYNHKCHTILSDPDPSLGPVVELLARCQIKLAFADPGAHEKVIENIIGSQDARARACLNNLPFWLPAEYEVYALKWVAQNSGGLPNKNSWPSTPDILITERERQVHYKGDKVQVGFGTVCIVQQRNQKRQAIATKNEVSLQMVNKGELGVCLGYDDDFAGGFLFLLDNGKIQPREVLQVVNAIPTTHGKQWKLKSVIKEMPQPAPVHPQLPETQDQEQPNQPVYPEDPDLPEISHDHPLTRQVETQQENVPSAVTPQRSGISLPQLPRSPAIQSPSSRPAVQSPSHQVIQSIFGAHQVIQSPIRATSLPDIMQEPVSAQAPASPSLRAVHISPLQRRISARINKGRDSRKHADEGYIAQAHDDALIADAIAQSSQEFLVKVKKSTETIPFVVAEDEIVLRDTPQDVMEALLAVATDDTASHQKLPDAMEALAAFDRLPATELRPVHTKTNKQISFNKARREYPKEKFARTTAVELAKLCRIGGLAKKAYPSKAALLAAYPGTLDEQIVPAVIVYKDKPAQIVDKDTPVADRETCRITVDGSDIPAPPGVNTFAPVTSDDDKDFVVAMMQAHCNKHGHTMNMSSADVTAAFPRCARAPGSPRIFILFPKTLPHPWAGCYVEVLGALYGFKESAYLFQQELCKVYKKAKYVADGRSPMTWILTHPTNPLLKSIASSHVDDVRTVDNDSTLTARLHAALKERFEEITIERECTMYAGIQYEKLPNGGYKQHQAKAIKKMASNMGVLHMPPVWTLDMSDFFETSTHEMDTIPIDPQDYQRITGSLIPLLRTRPDIRNHVSFLSSKNASPTIEDETKCIYVVRYLNTTIDRGCVYNAKEPIFTGTSDAAFANTANGHSTMALALSVGTTDAPFKCIAKPQSSVSPDPASAEYYAANKLCLEVAHFREFAAFLGWPQPQTECFLDANSAINTAIAPERTKKCRFMKAKHHFIREMVQNGEVKLTHVPTSDMRVDFLTKVCTASHFMQGRDRLLNDMI